MLSNMSSSEDSAKMAQDLKKAEQKRKRIARDIIFGLILAGLLVGIGTCIQRIVRKSEAKVIRPVTDVSDFSIVFIDGKATLSWVDSPDMFLDHIEVLYEPDGKGFKKIAQKVEKHSVPNLENGKLYSFAVKAVDRWGNKSDTTGGGSGKVLKQQNSVIKGTPVAKQVTLSWTNLTDMDYDHIEISYKPGHETPIRIHRGVETKTLVNLTNGVEYTFSIEAVGARGNRKFLNQAGIFIPDYPTSPESVFGRSSAGQVILAWKEPSFPFDFIEIVYSPEGEAVMPVTRGAGTKIISGLSDITDYEFTVYAVNSARRREPLKNVKLSSTIMPVFNGRDAEEFVIKAQPVAGQVKFEWDDPEMPNLNHIAIIYEPGDIDVPVIVDRGVKTQTVVGLSDSKEYRFVLYGVDTENNNRVITGVQFSTPRIPRLRIMPVAGKVTLVWSNPEDPNLDHVVLYCTPDRENPLPVAKRVEAYTFTNLSDSQEYEFRVRAVNTKGNVYGVARANVVVAKLPVVTGKPVDSSLSLGWIDPVDIRIDHVEIVYSHDGEKVQTVSRGMESYTFANLENDTEYAFTIYALDDVGNRHPVRSARIYDPSTAFALRSDSTFQTGELGMLNWKSTNSAAFGDSTVYALSFGVAINGTPRWVAGGSEGRMAYSNDYGLSWVQVGDSTFGNFPINAIGYGNGRWVAGGKSGKIAWSTNANVWNAVKKTHFSNSQAINAIAYGNGHWIAGGSNGIIILSDDDGATWRHISTNVFGKSAINTIVFHEGRWMAGGAAGKIAYSDDNGLTWTAVENSTFGSSAISVIVFDRNRWMAGGYAQSTAYSDDGITWQSLTRPFYILCMSFNGSRWVVGGQEGRMAWSGDGGKNWIIDEQGHNLFGSNWVQAIASGRASNGKRRWLSGGQNGKIIYADEP